MALSVGDRAPIAIQFPITTTGVDGNTVASVKCMVRRPNGVQAQWDLTLGAKTATTVAASFVLAADGSSLAEPGKYAVRAFAYDSGGALLFVTDESEFKVLQAAVQWPTP